jgi:hypothetical protein
MSELGLLPFRSPDPWLFGSRAMSRDDVAPRRFPPLCHLERSRSACDGAVERSMHLVFFLRLPDHPIAWIRRCCLTNCYLPIASCCLSDYPISRSPDSPCLRASVVGVRLCPKIAPAVLAAPRSHPASRLPCPHRFAHQASPALNP